MAVFSYVYYYNFVARSALSVGSVLAQVMKLEPQQQVGGSCSWVGAGRFCFGVSLRICVLGY